MALTNLLNAMGFLKSLGGIVLAVVILLAMVTVHELGHYIAGKILKFKITEFSIGFGPALFKRRSKKTGEIFAIRVVPLGGYCAFDGEDEYEEPKKEEKIEEPFAEMQTPTQQTENPTEKTANPEEKDGGRVEGNAEYPEPKGARFNDQAPWKRIIVLLAGVTMNYILSVLLILVMFAGFGRPLLKVQKNNYVLDEHGGKVYYNTEKSIETYNTGLQTGDIILEIDGKKMYLNTDYIDALHGKKSGEKVVLKILRDEKEELLTLTIVDDANAKNMSDTNVIYFSLGIACREQMPDENGEMKLTLTRGGGITQTYIRNREGFFQTIGSSFVYSFKIGGTLLRSLGELLTGKLGITSMGGPVTTIKVTSGVASSGVQSFLSIFAFIGVNLAVFNLLPIPALDGCKVIFCVIEWIRKKPVNRKVEAIINTVGILFLFGFAIFVDVLQFVL